MLAKLDCRFCQFEDIYSLHMEGYCRNGRINIGPGWSRTTWPYLNIYYRTPVAPLDEYEAFCMLLELVARVVPPRHD